jgi:hypothetical protein
LLSRAKPADEAEQNSSNQSKKKKKIPKLDDFLIKRDYVGATTLLEVCIVLSFRTHDIDFSYSMVHSAFKFSHVSACSFSKASTTQYLSTMNGSHIVHFI